MHYAEPTFCAHQFQSTVRYIYFLLWSCHGHGWFWVLFHVFYFVVLFLFPSHVHPLVNVLCSHWFVFSCETLFFIGFIGFISLLCFSLVHCFIVHRCSLFSHKSLCKQLSSFHCLYCLALMLLPTIGECIYVCAKSFCVTLLSIQACFGLCFHYFVDL